LYAASGAAFLTVVIAQTANAFACRSSRRPAWTLGWFSNRFLLVSVLVELAFALAMLVIPAASNLLDQQWPPAGAWIIVVASAPAVLVADALWKRHTTNR
jgi:magnesium-transporting ATPase (P-type)